MFMIDGDLLACQEIALGTWIYRIILGSLAIVRGRFRRGERARSPTRNQMIGIMRRTKDTYTCLHEGVIGKVSI
ncbi:hypothetical protein XI01_14425 [Bradyrhizobium sp. CCBAU 21360]|nr:hypothetical protein [Bradyrhizobium sp. CCBAU 21360]